MQVKAGPRQQNWKGESRPLRCDAIGDHVTNEEVRNEVQDANGKHDDLLFIAQTLVVWSYPKSLSHGQNNSANESKMNRKERKTGNEAGRQHQGLDRTGIWRIC